MLYDVLVNFLQVIKDLHTITGTDLHTIRTEIPKF